MYRTLPHPAFVYVGLECIAHLVSIRVHAPEHAPCSYLPHPPRTRAGGSAPPDARAARWDEGEVSRLRQEVEALAAALAALPSPRQQMEAEQALAAEVGALSSKIKYTEAEARVST